MLRTVLLLCLLYAPNASDIFDAEVTNAARDFRIRVYERFRDQRSVYDARTAQGRMMLDEWTGAGRPVGYRDQVTTWFHLAAQTPVEQTLPVRPLITEAANVTSNRETSVKVPFVSTGQAKIHPSDLRQEPLRTASADQKPQPNGSGSRILRSICWALLRAASSG